MTRVDHLTTRLGILKKEREKELKAPVRWPMKDPVIRKRLEEDYCPFYSWNGEGRNVGPKVLSEKDKAELMRKEAERLWNEEHPGESAYRPTVPEEKLMEAYCEGLTDRKIAERYGVCCATVGKWRKSRGLPKHEQAKKMDTAEAMRLYLQGKNDREIKEALGVSLSTVFLWREENNLKPIRKIQAEQKSRLPAELQKKRMELYRAGVSDGEIDRRLNLSQGNTRYWREINMLPSIYQRPSVDKTEFQRLYDQGLRDEEIAELVGCSIVTVTKWRNQNKLLCNRPYQRKKKTAKEKQDNE